MPSFGFSAFLKLLSLTDRRQVSELRKRLAPSEGGYDFHRGFRLLASRYLGRGEALADLLAEADGFANPAEARSARAALEYLSEWRFAFPGPLMTFEPQTFESPDRRFRVRYASDFGIIIGGQSVAVHIWKTLRPELDARMTYAALALFPSIYAGQANAPDDLAVLSVLTGRLYRLSDVPDQSLLAARIVAALDSRLEELGDARPPVPPPASIRV